MYQGIRSFLASHDSGTLLAAKMQGILWPIHAGEIEGYWWHRGHAKHA